MRNLMANKSGDIKCGLKVDDVHSGSFSASDILVEDGLISKFGKAPASGEEVVDLDGAYLLPGFIDCHVHICVNTESGDPNNPWRDALPGTVALCAAGAAKRMLHCGNNLGA